VLMIAAGMPGIAQSMDGYPALDTLRYGVAYYYEYMPYERLEYFLTPCPYS
jgi:hypothetical protein